MVKGGFILSANFTPELQPFKDMRPFRFWCQKVLPLVYDDSLSYYEVLCKLTAYLNDMITNLEGLHQDVSDLRGAFEQLREYVNNYFDNLDVQEEIDNKLDEMAENGTLSNIILKYRDMSNAKVYFLYSHVVGQSPNYSDDGVENCALINYNDKWFMVDCFTNYGFTNYASEQLTSLNVTKIDILFITHYDSDHVGGINYLCEHYNVSKAVLAPSPDFTTDFMLKFPNISVSYQNVIDTLNEHNIPYTFASNGNYTTDDIEYNVYNTNYNPYYSELTDRPSGNTSNDSDELKYSDYNNLSVWYEFIIFGRKILFTGDSNYSAFYYNSSNIHHVDVWNITHHNHNTWYDDFISTLSPVIAIAQDTYNEIGADIIGDSTLLTRKMGKGLLASHNTLFQTTCGKQIVLNVGLDGVYIISGSITDDADRKYYQDEVADMLGIYDNANIITPGILDLNQIKSNSVARAYANSQNTPIAGNGCTVIIQSNKLEGSVIQTAYDNGAFPRIFNRYINANNEWSDWYMSGGYYPIEFIPAENYVYAGNCYVLNGIINLYLHLTNNVGTGTGDIEIGHLQYTAGKNPIRLYGVGMLFSTYTPVVLYISESGYVHLCLSENYTGIITGSICGPYQLFM